MSIKFPLPYNATHIIDSFLNSIISGYHEKQNEFQPIWWNPYTPQCFSSLKSLLNIHSHTVLIIAYFILNCQKHMYNYEKVWIQLFKIILLEKNSIHAEVSSTKSKSLILLLLKPYFNMKNILFLII